MKRDQESHEDICTIRYEEIGKNHELLRSDIKSIKSSLTRFVILGLSVWVAVTGWALKSQWDMQKDTTQALIQMTQVKSQPQSNILVPYPRPSASPATPSVAPLEQ